MKIENGTTFTIKALDWREDWEFDHPTVILEPVYRYSPNGDSMEHMIEDLCIEGCVYEEIKDHDYLEEFDWRGWSWKNLKRTYRQALAGKKFPKKFYQAKQVTVEFYLNEYKELAFKILP